MRGELSETSPAALLTALADARARGRLVIDAPNGDGPDGDGAGRQATVTFRDGEVVDARAPGPRARLLDRLEVAGRIDEVTATQLRERSHGGRDDAAVLAQVQQTDIVDPGLLRRLRAEQLLDAVTELLAWRAGSYVLMPADDTDVGPDPTGPQLPVEAVLARAGRRRDRLDRLAALLPSLDVVPTPEPDAPLTLDPGPDLRAVLAAVDGHRDLRTLADLLGLGGPEVVRLIAGLHGLGLVGLPEPADPTAAAWADVRSLEDLPRSPRPASPAASASTSDPAPAADTAPPPEPAPATPDSPSAPEGGDTDVAAFLRELSSLALGDDVPTPASRRRSPPHGDGPAGASTGSGDPGSRRPTGPPASHESDPARRRRGLFGRG
jgi:hypothetical protein